MLVTFHSSTAGEIVMFANVAQQIVEILHKAPLARGVITLEQLPASIALVEQALARHRGDRRPAGDADDASVGIAQRLVAFLDFLQRTLRHDGYVLWEAPADFGPSRDA